MKETVVSIDPAGRIVLPKTVREELAIRPGQELRISIQGAAVLLTPEREESGFVRKGRALVFNSGGPGSLPHETVERLVAEGRTEHLSQAAGKPVNLKRAG